MLSSPLPVVVVFFRAGRGGGKEAVLEDASDGEIATECGGGRSVDLWRGGGRRGSEALVRGECMNGRVVVVSENGDSLSLE